MQKYADIVSCFEFLCATQNLWETPFESRIAFETERFRMKRAGEHTNPVFVDRLVRIYGQFVQDAFRFQPQAMFEYLLDMLRGLYPDEVNHIRRY